MLGFAPLGSKPLGDVSSGAAPSGDVSVAFVKTSIGYAPRLVSPATSVPIVRAAIALAPKTVIDTVSVAFTKASVALTPKTVGVITAQTVSFTKASVAFAPKPVVASSAIAVSKAATIGWTARQLAPRTTVSAVKAAIAIDGKPLAMVSQTILVQLEKGRMRTQAKELTHPFGENMAPTVEGGAARRVKGGLERTHSNG